MAMDFSENTSRRIFLKKALAGSAAAASIGYLLLKNRYSPLRLIPSTFAASKDFVPKEASFYEKLRDNLVQCQLCPHGCIVHEEKSGFCRVRKNIGGKLYSIVYGRPCTFDIGPIEKAPLYHFVPGHRRLCVATAGCNFRCKYCQNWHISQKGPGEVREYSVTVEEMVEEALRRNVDSISFTYTEPVVFYEYMLDISRLARSKGLLCSIVSNGYINPEPLKKLVDHLDAVKIDLKGFCENFYKNISSASLAPVLNTLKILREKKKHFEIVNLVVPSLNDDAGNIRDMCEWIKENAGENVPLHFSRFRPTYRLNHLSSTPVRTLENAVTIAHRAGLKYVYIGNVPGHKYSSTYCPECEKRLIRRRHFSVQSNRIEKGKCSFCGYRIEGVWEKT